MNQIVKLQDIPETLDMQELMEVKGGILDKSQYLYILLILLLQ